MAPRPPESLDSLRARIRSVDVTQREVRFQAPGLSHASHAVVFEAGRYRVRRLEVPDGAAEAALANTGHFMPEDAEALSVPTGHVVLDEATLDALLARLGEVK